VGEKAGRRNLGGQRTAEFPAVGINPDAIPSGPLERSKNRQLCKYGFPVKLQDSLPTVGVLNRFPLPQPEKTVASGNAHGIAGWQLERGWRNQTVREWVRVRHLV
jgi:hypothetical protein